MIFIFSNFGRSRLAAGAGVGDTLLYLTSDTGDRFPAPGAGQGFYVLVGSTSQEPEIRICTHRDGDVLTINALTKDWALGSPVINPVNAELLSQYVQHGEFGELVTWGTGDNADKIGIAGQFDGPHLKGESPILTWTGDQIAIDGVPFGPHLTGPSPELTWIGDRIAINGVASGPNLTGPEGTPGSTPSGSGDFLVMQVFS